MMEISLLIILYSSISYAALFQDDFNLTKSLSDSKTRIYFLVGAQRDRINNINTFIKNMSFERPYYEFINTFKKERLDENQLFFLKHTNFITDAWLERYINGVKDPKSRDKNLGKLALMLTLDNAMRKFLRSKFENMLVFEDDVIVNQKSYTIISAQHALSRMLSLPSSLWHIQYLGFCFECGNRTSFTVPNVYDNLYTPAIFPLCKHAILMSRPMVRLYLDVQKPIFSNKGDWIFHSVACKYGLRVIRPITPIFNQNFVDKLESSLGNHNDKRPFAKWVSCDIEYRKCLSLKDNYSIAARGFESI